MGPRAAQAIEIERRAATAGLASPAGRGLVIALACGWLLMLTTYTPMRDAGGSLTTDAFAYAKLAVRIGVAALLAPLAAWLWASPRRPAIVRALAPWGLFLAWALLSVAWSPLKTFSLVQVFSLGVLLTLSLAVALGCDGRQAASRGFFSLALALAVCSSVLLLLRIVQPESGSLSRDADGVFHCTAASAAAGLGIVLLVGGVLLGRWTWAWVLMAPGFAVHSAVLALANSRQSIFATAVTVLGLFFLFCPRGWRSLAVAAGAVVGIGYLTLDGGLSLAEDAVATVAAYAARGQSAQQLAALSGRAEMWEAIWSSYLRSPVIGHGYFVSSEAGEIYVWYSWANWTAHNFWLQVLVSTGLVGAALLALALIRTFGGLFLAAVRGTVEWRLAAFLLALVAWYAMWGLTNESYMGPLQPESIVFFTSLGLAAGLLADGSQTMLAKSRRWEDRPA